MTSNDWKNNENINQVDIFLKHRKQNKKPVKTEHTNSTKFDHKKCTFDKMQGKKKTKKQVSIKKY